MRLQTDLSALRINKGADRGPDNARNDGNERIKFLQKCRNTNFIIKDIPVP